MRVRGGAHTRLIGEQAALGAVGDGRDDAEERATDSGLRAEGALEDECEGTGDVLPVHDENDDRAHHVEHGHDGYHLLGDGCQAVDVSDEHEPGEHGDDDADHPGFDGECRVHGRGDGVGLHHGADEAQGDDDGHGEETGKGLAALALERGGDVIGGTAVNRTVGVDHAGLLRHDGLGIIGRHAQKGDEPHPEDGAGATYQNGAAGADDVTGADLRGNGRGQGLK